MPQASAPIGAGLARPASRPVATRRWARPGGVLLPTGTTLAFLGLWELASRASIAPDELPAPTQIASWLGTAVTGSPLWEAVGQTLLQWGTGLVVGGLAGITVGLVVGTLPTLERATSLLFEALRPIPGVIYLPLLLLLLGARPQVAIILTAISAFWPLLFQTLYGVKALDPMAQDTARVYGLSNGQRLRFVTVPNLLPFVATGVRVGASLALVATVSIELVGAVPGLGRELIAYSQNGVYDGVFGLIFVAGCLGVALNVTLERLERRALRWHPSQRRAGS